MDVDVVFDGCKTLDFNRATVIAVSGGCVATVLKAVVSYLDIRVVDADANRAIRFFWTIVDEDKVVKKRVSVDPSSLPLDL